MRASPPATAPAPPVRLRSLFRVRGVVQGVGFRPAVCRLARTLGLGGFVRNERDVVRIEVEGSPDAVKRFADRLAWAAPPPARVDGVECDSAPARGDREFVIDCSEAVEAHASAFEPAAIPPDLGPCDECLHELCDPHDRRYRYPFINCTACGPRFTIVRAMPYDRARTTMDAFTMCDACRREYSDPADRRFHAEPNACPACGPTAVLMDQGRPVACGDAAVAAAARALSGGRIVAVKGAGGYALAVDACDSAAVARLRRRKRRPHKPLAVMVRSLAHAARVAELDGAARAALASPARPIVLCPAQPGDQLAAEVAPGLADLGLFLPPTPLQYLLATDGPPYLVMTSGNRSSEPIAIDDADAIARLSDVADLVLIHGRTIWARADDSVVRAMGSRVMPVRRARGTAPQTVRLAAPGPTALGAGGQLCATACLSHRGLAYLSQHIGDLDDPATFDFYRSAIERLRAWTGAEPEIVAHDLHPDLRSTRWALESGLPTLAVQHHHAHVAACLADNGRTGPVLGVTFDGTGYGPDGTLWGGELLVADLGSFRRVGHLRPLALAGGEAAIREPWRLALAALLDAGVPPVRPVEVDPVRWEAVRRILEAGVATGEVSGPGLVLATGAGRWFDAVAALCSVATGPITYDGQPAAQLEAAAALELLARRAASARPASQPPPPYDLDVADAGTGPFEIDLRPTVRAIADELAAGAAPGHVAARFHETLAAAIRLGARQARAAGAPGLVALSGGCFQNRLLATRARALLEADGFTVLEHQHVPPGDGGLSLGQAQVASAWLSRSLGGGC